MTTRIGFATRLLAAGLPVMIAAGAAWAEPLSVCIDKASPSADMDRRLVAAVAKVEGTQPSIFSFDGTGDGDDGFDIREFHTLLQASCGLVLGFPVDTTHGLTPPGLSVTPAYAHVGFVLLTPKGMKTTALEQLPKGTKVGVTYLTVPNLFLDNNPELDTSVFDTEDETMQNFADHAMNAVMVWGPTAMHYRQTHPRARGFDVHDLNEPHTRWNLVGLYTAAGSAAAAQFEHGVTALGAQGKLSALLAPFAQTAAAEPADRGAPQIILAAATVSASAAGSPPALYTMDQAKSGATKFAANCAQCHGDDLSGLAGPALRGPNFASQKADFAVGDVFKILSNNMPATQPGTLPHVDYEDIMAFLLQQNGYPAGATKLTYGGATNSAVPLRFHGT